VWAPVKTQKWERTTTAMGDPGARDQSERAEAAKAQVHAAHLPSGDAPSIIDRAEAAARDAVGR
jgi:hypothetical protein